MNTLQSAEYLGYDVAADRPRAMKQFYEFARRHGVQKFHRGSKLLFRRVDLDRAVGNAEIDDVGVRMLRSEGADQRRRRA